MIPKKINILLIISVITALLCALLYVYFYNIVNTNKLEVSSALADSKGSQMRLANLQEVSRNLKDTTAYGDRISLLFVRQEEIVNFIQVVEGLMKDIGVSGSVDSVTEQTNPSLDAIGREQLQLTITANGAWSPLANLAGLLERLPYKSTVNSFTLQKQTKISTDAKGKNHSISDGWELKLQMVVWVIKTPPGMSVEEATSSPENIN